MISADLAYLVAHFLLQVLRERFAVDELHDDVSDFIVFAIIVNLHDARVTRRPTACASCRKRCMMCLRSSGPTDPC